jgi:N-formylglutamate deformylase
MTDADFLAAFESVTLPPHSFDHRGHLRVACLYLADKPFLEACIAMRDGLRRFAASIGKAGLYHETVTIAFMSIVADRMAAEPGVPWEELLRRHPDLCDRGLLARYVEPGVLASEGARARLVLGARVAAPTPSMAEAG